MASLLEGKSQGVLSVQLCALHRVLSISAWFSEGEGSAVQLPLNHEFCPLEGGCLIDIWKPSMLSHGHHFGCMCQANHFSICW